jgi:hypothetical protein
MIVIYVNDLIFTKFNLATISWLKNALNERFEMSDLNSCIYYLDMMIFRIRRLKQLILNQSVYVEQIKNMNIIINITKTFLEESNVERRSLRTKIKKYLHRVKIVENSKTLKLLRQTIVLLTINSSSQTINNKDSELYYILQRMQTIIEQLQKKNENSTSKSKNYTNVVRFVVESTAMSKRVEKRVENSSIRKRSNRSKNSRSISSTTKKERSWKKWLSKTSWKKCASRRFETSLDSKAMRWKYKRSRRRLKTFYKNNRRWFVK